VWEREIQSRSASERYASLVGVDERKHTEQSGTVLPSSRDFLESAGLSFDFFVDSLEGVQVPLDAAGISKLADAAQERLLQTPADAETLTSP
jgi:hypothetical protein